MTNRKYPQLHIFSLIVGIKSPVGDSISNLGLSVFESSKAEPGNKSPIPNWVKYPQLQNKKANWACYAHSGIFFC